MKAFWISLALLGAAAPALAQPSREAMIDRLMAQDANRDGAVTLAEAQAARAAIFARLDADNSGALSEAERAAVSQQMGGMGLRRADANRDGQISRAEFMNMPYRVFDRFDANNDDVLDASEIAALRARAGL